MHPMIEPHDVLVGDRRWQVETNLRHLKTTMGMDVLRYRTVDGVTKEPLAYAIDYNLVRLAMLDAATRQGVPPGLRGAGEIHRCAGRAVLRRQGGHPIGRQ